MKRKLSFAVLAVLGAFALVVLSGVPLPYAAHAQASPSAAVSLSSASVEEGAAITVTMSFSGLESDADTATRDYVFRADVVGADECEDRAGGYGLGVDRSMWKVDQDPEVRTGSVSADCPAGDYTVQASISSPDSIELASARASFTVTAPAPEPTPEPTPDQEDPDPSAALALSPAGFAPWNTKISVTMLFGGLKADSDRDTTDYVFRADVVDADACEGGGLGIDRYMYQVDQDPEARSGTIAAGCPIGGYTIEASIATEADGVVASTSAEFSIFGPSIGLAIPVTEQGAGGVLTLSFGFLAPDADPDTTDYIFRADVVDADACEGDGLGVDRYIHQVDQDPETHTGTISAGCPPGDYTLEVSVSSPGGVKLAQASAGFSVAEPEEEDDPPTSAEQLATPSSDITLPSANANPWGIWSDSSTIRVADRIDDKLYAYTLADGTRQTDREFALHSDNGTPRGIWSDGTTIWVADSDDNELYAYALDGGTRQAAKEFNLHSGNRNSVGIWSDGTTIWVTDFFADKLYAYALDGGTRQAAKEFNLHGDNSASRGIWSNGTTIWVADAIDNKLYAYALDDGTRQADREFNLHSDNAGVQGLWSNGTTIWVADHTDRKLYAYALPQLQPPTLTALTVSPGTLTPDFSSGTTEYTVPDVPHSGSRITITATAGTGATVSYEDGAGNTLTDVDAGATGDQFDLEVGDNTVKVKVTKGSASQTYTLTVTRAEVPPTPTPAPPTTASPSSDITLHSDNSIPLGIWSDETTIWVADLDDDKLYAYALADGTRQDGTGGTTIWVTDSFTDKLYAYALADGTRQDGSGGTTNREFDLHNDNGNPRGIWSNSATIWVADFNAKKLYAYALPGALALPTLTALAVNPGTLTPAFSSGTLEYTVPDVPHSGSQITVTATAETDASVAYEDGAGNTITDADAGTTGVQLGLEVGNNTIRVKVTRGSASRTYTLTVSRAEAPPTPGAPTSDITLHSDNGDPAGIWSDRTTVWVADGPDGKLYAYALDGGTRQDGSGGATDKEFDLHSDNGSPRGVWSDGATIWVADFADSKLYAYALDGGTRQDGTGGTTNKEFALHGDNGSPRGVWSDGATVWVADFADSKLYAYALDGGARQDGTGGTTNKEFALHGDNGSPRGVWSDGATVWVADFNDDKLYAYALDGGARQDGSGGATNRELDLHGDNGNPWGIWSDGETMWVADFIGDKLYAYALPGAPALPILPALSALGISPGTLSPSFSPGVYAYTASAANSVTSVTVTPTVNDSNASVTVDGTTVASGSGHAVSLDVGANVIRVVVTAQDGTTQTYTITVTRVASSDAALPVLTALTVSPGTLTPAFTLGAWYYTVIAASSVTRVTLTVTAETGATIALGDGSNNPVRDADSSAAGIQLDLAPGRNIFRFHVTKDGATNVYTVVVYRGNPPGRAPSPLYCEDPQAREGAPARPGRPGGTWSEWGTVDLDWGDVATTTTYRVCVQWGEGAWVPLHRIIRTDGGVGLTMPLNFPDPPAGSEAAVTGLPADVASINFKVQAVNKHGASAWSAVENVSVPEQTPPTAAPDTPGRVNAHFSHNLGAVVVDWEPVPGARWYWVAVYDYAAERWMELEEGTRVGTARAEMYGSGARVMALPGSARYYFTVAACNREGCSDYSEEGWWTRT